MDILSNPTIKTNMAAAQFLASPVGSSGDIAARSFSITNIPALSALSAVTPEGVDSLFAYDNSGSQNARVVVDDLLKLVGEGYISGLGMEWVSTTQIKVTSGIAYIQSTGKLLKLSADSTISPSLSASTWHHLYLYSNSGTPTIESSTTAPVQWIGTARSKSGDTTRRYIGSFRTNASSQIYKFYHNPHINEVLYLEATSAAPFRVVGPGQATTLTTVNCSSVVPVTAQNFQLRAINYFVGAAFRLRQPSGGVDLLLVNDNTEFVLPFTLNTSQQFDYICDATPTGINGFYGDVKGYYYLR